MVRTILVAIFAIFLLAAVGCDVNEMNATSTSEAGGIDRTFLSNEATAAADEGDFDDRLLIIDATATAEAGGQDDRLTLVYANATAETIEYNATATAEAIVWNATSTAIAIEEDEEEVETSTREVQNSSRGGNSGTGSTGTPAASDTTPVAIVPTAITVSDETATPVPAPEPTSTPVPVPTATEQPVVTNAWLTALQAVDIATAAQAGQVKTIVSHVAHKSGQNDAGDSTNTTASPGAGYASSWEVSLIDGDDHYYCDVKNGVADCTPSSYPGAPYVSATDIDSTAMFDIWESNSDWKELLRNENISVLAHLHTEGEGTSSIWTASVTVHGDASGLRGGNFNWILESGETNYTTYQ